jgi:hypothetical protein
MEIIKDTFGNDIVFIVNEDGSTTSMLKSTYEAQQAEQSTPIVTEEAATD